jgi:hypothetical protein
MPILPQEASLEYENMQYDFTFTLPLTWEGYSIVQEQWQGQFIDQSDLAPLTGPKILIRSPQWTDETPRQDIPIMVFTVDQWDRIQKEELAVSAAPIPPSELGRNEQYVFALPARYNFAFFPGFEEVESILNNNPLVTE